MFKRSFIFPLILSLGILIWLSAIHVGGGSFPDAPSASPDPAVSWLSAHGIIKGFPDGDFRPEEPITRAEFTVLLTRLLHPGLGKKSASPAFADLPPGFWADREISVAAAEGWVKGVPDGRRILFLPQAPLHPSELAAMLGRALGLPRPTTPETLFESGLLGKFRPRGPGLKGTVSRAEAAEILYRYGLLSTEHLPRVKLVSLPTAALGRISAGRILWAPAGDRFAYWSPEKKAFLLGRTDGSAPVLLLLPDGRHPVDLTEKGVVMASADDRRDWIYPYADRGLGEPTAWTEKTDTWQEWVETADGPAILTGGYHGSSLALATGKGSLLLGGGEAYLSSDRRWGAVTPTNRPERYLNPQGDTAMLTEDQPTPAGSVITVWDFAAAGGPRQVSVLQLPKDALSKPGASIDSILFSPNDQKIAVSLQNAPDGPSLTGATYIFSSGTGELLGKAPYGNGMAWFPKSEALWLNTPLPGGTGLDQMVGSNGKTLRVWPDAFGRPVWLLNRWFFLVPNGEGRLGIGSWDRTFHPLQDSGPKASRFRFFQAEPSPTGTAALLFQSTDDPSVYRTFLAKVYRRTPG